VITMYSVGAASFRASTVTATGSAFFRAYNNGGPFVSATPQNRIFVRFNMRPSRYPLSASESIFQWMRGSSDQGPVIKLEQRNNRHLQRCRCHIIRGCQCRATQCVAAT
jgi:hypothetical protein